MRTCHTALIAAQVNGFPTGGYQPAVRCIFTPSGTVTAGTATYDYSFNPTLNTNRMVQIEQREVIGDDGGTIILNNYDHTIPDDLTGYYIDIGWGMQTASSIMWDAGTAGAVAPRVWVMQQSEVSGGTKGSQPQLYKVYELGGVWNAVLNQQPVRIGVSPTYQDENGVLADMTIYSVLEYLIETALTAQTGMSFTLDALGTQDDGLISSIKPYPIVNAGSFVVGTSYRILTVGTMTLADWQAVGAASDAVGVSFEAIASGSGPNDGTATSALRSLNESLVVQTYAQFIASLMELTKCVLIARAGLAFKIIYPP